MKFICPNCNLNGNIDDAKVPEQGLYANCPKCKTRFLVQKSPAPAPPPAPPENSSSTAGRTPDPHAAAGHGNPPAANRGPVRPKSGAGPTAARSYRPASTTSDSDLAIFIGKNSDTYLKKFDSFNKGGSDGYALTWHWPAFFVPFWWLLYRKQYAWAALAFFIRLIPVVGLLSMFAFGLSGNYIYYTYSKRKLREINSLPSELGKATAIARAGGVNNLIWLLAPLIGVAIIGILAAIAIPQFAAYRMKAFNATTVSELRKAKTCVDNYYTEHRAYPADLEQANYRKAENVEVQFTDLQTDKYTILAAHKNGDKECAATSDSPALACRAKKDQNGEFVPVE